MSQQQSVGDCVTLLAHPQVCLGLKRWGLMCTAPFSGGCDGFILAAFFLCILQLLCEDNVVKASSTMSAERRKDLLVNRRRHVGPAHGRSLYVIRQENGPASSGGC